MTLGEALRALAQDAGHVEGWQAVLTELERLSRSSGVVPAFREESVGDVLEKLLQCVRQPGWVEDKAHPEAYVRTMLSNRSRSLLRREKRRQAIEEQGPKPVAPADPPPPLPDRKRLEELYTKARSRRQPRYRHHLEAAWTDLDAVLGGATLTQALEARGEEATPKALNSAYKAQERLRTAMLDVIDYRRSTGNWTDADAEVYTEEVRLLLRCQGRGLSGVSGGEKRHDD